MDKIVNFLKEVKVELAKVSWPTRKQTVVYTGIVIGLSLFFALVLGLFDILYQFLINKFLVG